jgi:hypothetical protein
MVNEQTVCLFFLSKADPTFRSVVLRNKSCLKESGSILNNFLHILKPKNMVQSLDFQQTHKNTGLNQIDWLFGNFSLPSYMNIAPTSNAAT